MTAQLRGGELRAINAGDEESKSKATKNADINVKYVSEKERTGERRIDA